MEFRVPYLNLMRERAPKLFNQLRKSGQMDAHLQAKMDEAFRMRDELSKDRPNDPMTRREIEEQVMAAMAEFPNESAPTAA